MNIRIHPNEAQQADNFSSIELNDGTGDQMAMLTVFHSLHCLVSPTRLCSVPQHKCRNHY